MRGLNVFAQDVKRMLRSPITLITLVVVACLPILYSGVMIKGAWDPYGKLDQLPVAVVNLDAGADYEGTALEVGKDLVKELKQSDSFKWSFVTAEEAKEGIESNHYYMTVTIPKDFSEKATTLMSDRPEQAEIIYEPNWDYNYVAGQIGANAVKEMKTNLSAKLTESYTRSMLEQVQQIASGLNEAGNGASQLGSGAGQLKSGVDTLKANLAKLADGSLQMESGVKPLTEGASKLHTGTASLSSGASTLADGLKQLSAGEKQLETGAASTKQGADQLADGLAASSQGSHSLVAGLESSSAGAAQLASGLQASAEASTQLAGGAQQLAAGLEQLAAANPELAQSTQVQQLLAASRQLAQGSEKLSAGQQQLLEGSQSLASGQQKLLEGGQQLNAGDQKLLQGAQKLAAGQSKLTGGLQQFGAKLNEAAAGGAQLASGAVSLNDGAAQLASGLTALNGGAASLADGSQQLASGAGQLQSGTVKLSSGLDELAGKLTEAGSQAGDVKSDDAMVNMFAQPVKITENTDRKVTLYGQGIAPYFLSMALFVGGLVLTVVVPTRTTSVPGASRFGSFLSRTLTFVLMSLAQSLIAGLILLYGVGIEVKSVPLFLTFVFITSLTFLMIIQSIVTWLDQPGRFVVIILMILQITSSAGTFPREMLPGWMQSLNPFLPMTHSIKGMKAVISIGDYGMMWHQAGLLLSYAAAFMLLTLVFFLRQDKGRNHNEQQEAVIA